MCSHACPGPSTPPHHSPLLLRSTPQVPPQYPPEVREVLLRSRNNSLKYDYSQPDYEAQKAKIKTFYSTF